MDGGLYCPATAAAAAAWTSKRFVQAFYIYMILEKARTALSNAEVQGPVGRLGCVPSAGCDDTNMGK